MKPITLGLATGLFVLTCLAPIVPGSALTYGNPSRIYSLSEAFFKSDLPAQIGNFMLTSTAQAAETVMEVTAPTQTGIDISKLVKIADDEYNVTAASSVSMEPLGSSVVRKIGYGNEIQVSVVTTSTGTYSTDGLASPNVLYPGITVTKANNIGSRLAKIRTLNGTGHWSWLNLAGNGSFVTFGSMQGGGSYITGEGGTCLRGKNFAGCY